MIKFFLKNELFALIISFLLLTHGIFAYFNLPRDEDPGFKIRTATVSTKYKGASPKFVDKYLTQIIEDELRTIPELEHVRSKSRFGLSTIYIDIYEKYKDLQPIWDKARRRLEKIQPSLPDGTKPYLDDEFGDVFGILVALCGRDYSYFELKDIADKLRLEFLRLSQVAKVDLHGLKEQAIYIEFDRGALKKYKITPEYLSNYLANYNIIFSSGSIKSNDKKLQILLNENLSSIDDVRKIQILTPDGTAVLKLSDIFKIEEKYVTPPDNFVLRKDDDAIIFAISLKSGGNIFTLEREVKNLIDKTNAKYPIGLNLSVVANQPDYVKYLTNKFTSSLFQSVLIVVFLILLFLGVKIGLIVGFVIPLVVFSTFFVMSKIGVGLEKISLSALIISLGILVDNSIVISEGMLKRLSKLKSATPKTLEALSYSSTNEFFYPLLVSTTITVCAFSPIYLAKSTVSEYTSSMMKVVALALYFSLFFSVTLLPHLIKRFYKAEGAGERASAGKKEFKIEKYFLPILKRALCAPKNVLKLALCLFLASFVCFYFVPKIFFPDSDRPMFEVKIILENGVDIYKTRNTVLKIQKFLDTIPEINETSSYIGQGSPRYVLSATPESPKSNYALMIVNTNGYRGLDKIIKNVQEFCDKTFAAADIVVRKVPIGPPYDAPVEIRILGHDIDEIMRLREQVANILRAVKYVTLVEDDWGDKIPNLTLDINHFELARQGASPYSLGAALEGYIDGIQVDNFRRRKDTVSLIFALSSKYPLKISDVDTFDFYSEKTKNSIPFAQVMKVKPDFNYPEIIRRDGLYALTVKAYINKNKTTAASVLSKITPKINKLDFTQGYVWEVGGINENSKKGNSSIIRELPVAFGFILLLLIGYFSSIKDAALIALIALFALSGANFGLFITRSYFGFMTFLGYISLVGMATNNSVVLLDYFRRSFKNKEKITVRDIILKTKNRIRPICLTIATTIAGMLPLWLGADAMFSSMAIAIIFGLLTSTFATIILAPSLFVFLNKIK